MFQAAPEAQGLLHKYLDQWDNSQQGRLRGQAQSPVSDEFAPDLRVSQQQTTAVSQRKLPTRHGW